MVNYFNNDIELLKLAANNLKKGGNRLIFNKLNK